MKYEILKMKDPSDKYYTKHDLFDLPMRLAVVGKSFLSGKTTFVCNMLLREKFYRNHFLGENIYIVSNNKVDKKLEILMEQLDVPKSNYMSYNEGRLMALYDILEEQFIEETEDKGKPFNRLIIIDDCGYTASLKGGGNGDGFISLLACNSRHINLSVCINIQKYTQLSTTYRNNLSGLILFSTSQKEVEQVIADHNYNNMPKEWVAAFRSSTKEKNSFFVVNYSNDIQNRYLDSNFKPIAIGNN